jgi:hypothetical protein
MDLLREKIKDPKVTGIAGLVVGLILGWFVIGWGIWPVTWTDALPQHLNFQQKEEYLRMAIDSYTLTPDSTVALYRWEALQPGAEEVLAAIEAQPGPQAATLSNFAAVVRGAEAAPPAGEATAPVEEAAAPTAAEATPTEEAETEGRSNLTFLLVMCLVTIILGGALAAYFLFRPKRAQEREYSPAAQAQRVSQETPPTDFGAREGVPPMSQFMTTYMVGDDLFDDSFSVDSPTGEFLGECGVGISETVGVGEPKKVTAFEVWLFDKNDIQTVTKVLMSQHAFSDDALRTRLTAKGDPFLVQSGMETELETATLRLVARVVDMAYGSGPSPENSYFERLTLELAVWQKA